MRCHFNVLVHSLCSASLLLGCQRAPAAAQAGSEALPLAADPAQAASPAQASAAQADLATAPASQPSPAAAPAAGALGPAGDQEHTESPKDGGLGGWTKDQAFRGGAVDNTAQPRPADTPGHLAREAEDSVGMGRARGAASGAGGGLRPSEPAAVDVAPGRSEPAAAAGDSVGDPPGSAKASPRPVVPTGGVKRAASRPFPAGGADADGAVEASKREERKADKGKAAPVDEEQQLGRDTSVSGGEPMQVRRVAIARTVSAVWARGSDKVYRPLPPQPSFWPRNARYRSNYLPGRGDLAHLAAEVSHLPVSMAMTAPSQASPMERTLPAPDRNSLRVAVDLSHRLLPLMGGREVVRVRLRSTDSVPPGRGPLRLHLVLDRSGSMKGKPWQQVCAAVRDLASRLGPQDRLSVALFSDTASILTPPQPGGPDLQAVANAVCRTAPRGETYTFAGLALGYQQARASYDPAATNRVLLISDGMPTIGSQDPYTLTMETARALGEGITTSALGVGRDFDALLMDRIALEGGGNHHFVRDASALPAVLTDEIEVLSHQAAEAVDVRVRLPRGVQLVEVVGSEPLNIAESLRTRQVEVAGDQRLARDQGIAADRQRDVEGGVRFLLPTFRAGDEHTFVLVVDVPPGSGPQEVVRVEVRYKDTIAGRNASFVGGRGAQLGAEMETAEASADHAVLLAEARVRTAWALQRASEYLDRANLPGIRTELYAAAMGLQRAADRSGSAVAHADAERLRGLADGLTTVMDAGQRPWMVSVLHYYWRTCGVTVWEG